MTRFYMVIARKVQLRIVRRYIAALKKGRSPKWAAFHIHQEFDISKPTLYKYLRRHKKFVDQLIGK